MSGRREIHPGCSAPPGRSHVASMGRAAMFALLAAGAAFARTVAVPPPAMPEYADTEVSTNMAFNADDAHLREFEMRFALDGR